MFKRREFYIGLGIVALFASAAVANLVIGSSHGRAAGGVLYAKAQRSSPENPIEMKWEILKKYNYKTGEMPDSLRALNNEYVRMPGFVVPLEDNAGSLTEFLLVPSQMSCIHVPPPPPNFIVYVEAANKNGIKNTWDAVWLVGQLSVGATDFKGEKYFLSIRAENMKPYSE